MEAIQYELARNMTLLFFFERLLDKGEPRTLHDLSCQFGSKGFTKEMRQIAGGSQSGLKKFLAQYPSLFSMEGEYVTISTFQHCGSKSSTGGSSIKKYLLSLWANFRHQRLQHPSSGILFRETAPVWGRNRGAHSQPFRAQV